MKYLLLLLFFTIQAFSSSIITQYYQEIYNNTSINQDFLSYKLYQQHNQWYAKETKYQDATAISPYIKKDYIQLSQETGDGRETIDIKLWQEKNALPLIVITKSYFSDNHIESSKILFLIKENQKWQIIQPLKEIGLNNFLQESMTIKELNVLKNIGIIIFYDIQKKENALFIRLAINKKLIDKVCQHDTSLQVDNPEDYLYYCKHLQKKLKPPMQFRWNEQKQQLLRYQ